METNLKRVQILEVIVRGLPITPVSVSTLILIWRLFRTRIPLALLKLLFSYICVGLYYYTYVGITAAILFSSMTFLLHKHSLCNGPRYICPIQLSIYVATAPYGSWPTWEDASILLCLLLLSTILVFLGSVMCPSRRRPSILFLFFSLVFYYEISH
jgi:hypothetical protein